jgi:hypothetical protein
MHLTMGISIHFHTKRFMLIATNLILCVAVQISSVSEMIEMDRNYLQRIKIRRQVMDENREIVLAADPSVKTAVEELYIWMFSHYLPLRFPRMFRIKQDSGNPRKVLNMVTSEEIPLQPPNSSVEALKILGSHLDEDFLFLLPSPDGDGYRLQGFVTCFPSGFNTRTKLHMKLREIHSPVPSYKQKLEKSMDRFFERLEVGKFVKRANVRLLPFFQTYLNAAEPFHAVDNNNLRRPLRAIRDSLV